MLFNGMELDVERSDRQRYRSRKVLSLDGCETMGFDLANSAKDLN